MDETADNLVYEDEAVELLSLSDGEVPQLEDVHAELEIMELSEGDLIDKEGQEQSEGEEAASGPIFQPLRDDSVGCFSEHKGPVFVVSIGNDSSHYVASGGQDDRAFVWKLSDKQISFECTGHRDSVTCTTFSHDSKYLATSDLSGFIQVWLTSNGKCIWNFETSTVEWLRWHSHAHVLLAGTSDGEGWMWKIPSGECKTIPSHGSGNMAAILQANGKSIVCGYDDGSVKLWDLKTMSLMSSHIPSANQMSSVTCLCNHPDNSIVASGHINGATRLYNPNTLKLLGVLMSRVQHEQGDSEVQYQSIESVGFIASHNLIAVGVVSGEITVWDIPTQKLRHVCQPQKDVCGLVKLYISHIAPVIYSCYTDGIVRLWDILTGSCNKEWHGHSAGILDITLTRDESLMLTSSDDMTIRIYQTR